MANEYEDVRNPNLNAQQTPRSSEADPVSLVEVRRGDITECIHYGHFVVATPAGEILDGAGDAGLITYPRSSLKLVQAIGLVESGAADHFKLESRHISLACASHRGEPFHIDTVTEWLDRIGCTTEDLACGPALPSNPQAMEDVLATVGGRRPIYHNCSGKHTGFLTVCRHLDFDPAGYDALDHPSQKRYLDDLSLLTGSDARNFAWGIDGCTLPAPAFPLAAMATAMARLAQPKGLGGSKQESIHRVLAAVSEAPEFISGTGQVATQISIVTKGRIISKPGAEGYFVAVLRDRGVGVALKIIDGAARASAVAMIAVLNRLGALTNSETDHLIDLMTPVILDTRGRPVGEIRPTILSR